MVTSCDKPMKLLHISSQFDILRGVLEATNRWFDWSYAHMPNSDRFPCLSTNFRWTSTHLYNAFPTSLLKGPIFRSLR